MFDRRKEEVAGLYESLERDLICHGVTAVEDKLQEEVPETVQYLIRAGMHVWILTGDKLQTALTIAFSSSIITPDMALSIVDSSDWGELQEELRKAQEEAPGTQGKALVIGGAALALAQARAEEQLVALCQTCTVIVCARCAPAQKAQVVDLVNRRLEKVSLAVGDGGNDVPMILAANVGIGIMGNEGMQAARSSDFAIGEFRHLKKLLAVHGRHSCLRTSDVIKYSFFKNICFCSPQVVYFFYTLFSSTTIYNAWIILGFNIIFTGLPPFALAIFEKDLTQEVIFLYPELYCCSDRKQPLSLRSFVAWELQAVLQGIVLTLGILYSMASYEVAPYEEGGQVSSADGVGMVLAEAVVWSVTLKIIVVLRHWTIITHICIWLSVFAFYMVLLTLNTYFCPLAALGDSNPVSTCGTVYNEVLRSSHSWLVVILWVCQTFSCLFSYLPLLPSSSSPPCLFCVVRPLNSPLSNEPPLPLSPPF
eukprot:768392-Hanusia_phi.AAC.8